MRRAELQPGGPARAWAARGSAARAEAAGRIAEVLARAVVSALVLLGLAVTALVGQEPPRTLTLAQAVALAERNNPRYRSTQNDQEAADWQVREAYASFLPRVNASAGVTYQEPGVQRIGAIDFGAASTDYLYSGYELGLTWNLDGNTIFQSSSARANREATQARIRAAGFDLESAVTLQYMAALRARDGVEIARRQLDRAQQNLELATVRAETGAVAAVDAKQAEVERGRAQVALIQAERLYRTETLRLSEQVGVELPPGVELASEARPFEPAWTLEELLEHALTAHPSLRSAQAREAAGRAGLRQARSGYFPSVSVSTGLRGNAVEELNKDYIVARARQNAQSRLDQCQLQNALVANLNRPYPGFPQNCGGFALSEGELQDMVSRSEVFPFDFTRNPLQLSLTVSVPVFNGLATQRQVEQAAAAAKDAEEDRRAEELRLRTAVTQAYDNLVTGYQLIGLQDRNRQVAEQRLTMARQRYAVGAANILELLDAQTSVQTAERDYLNSLYDFQINLATLEAASGQRLRAEG